MKRLCTATRGLCSWRDRLANPDRQWRREYSAFEAAVSWEGAAATESGLPGQIHALMETAFGSPKLLLAVAEHKVSLPGGNADSQNDVWALVETEQGKASLCIEAKAQEPFGATLGFWLQAGGANRVARWDYIRGHLPATPEGAFLPVAYQLLHRCASAVIEARRFGLQHAACIVQAFNTPNPSFAAFTEFCQVMGMNVPRGGIQTTIVDDVHLAIGWADCPLALDAQIAAIV